MKKPCAGCEGNNACASAPPAKQFARRGVGGAPLRPGSLTLMEHAGGRIGIALVERVQGGTSTADLTGGNRRDRFLLASSRGMRAGRVE